MCQEDVIKVIMTILPEAGNSLLFIVFEVLEKVFCIWEYKKFLNLQLVVSKQLFYFRRW